MKSIKLILGIAAISSIFTLSSCGDDDLIPTTTLENTLALCQDGIDNDGDGVIDCDDGDCAAFTVCVVNPGPTCTDGMQNGDETGVDCGGSCDPCTEALPDMIETRTLDASIIYTFDGFTRVASGATLTIPAGTILKAALGQGEDASAFIVQRGATIDAQGTADNPIIFTSEDDGITPGTTTSTLEPESLSQGLWGGLIVLGNAPVSVNPDDAADGIGREGFIEGIPSSNDFSRYGGDDANDNSGILNYVSIRYTGTALATNEEIQGLTMGGVGDGTTLSNIEIFSSFDDGIELFGGTVNITNLLVAYQTDDAIDVDQNYSGTIDNSIVLLFNPNAGNDGMEIDGPEAEGVNDDGFFTITNTTIYQNGGANITRVKSDAQGTVSNLIARDFLPGQVFLDGGAEAITLMDSQFGQSEMDAITNDGGLTLMNNLFNVTDFTTGADESVFSWTFAAERGDF